MLQTETRTRRRLATSGWAAALVFAAATVVPVGKTAEAKKAAGRKGPPLSAGLVKHAADRAGNWLVEQYNLKKGTFGRAKTREMPGLVALVVHALAVSPRRYREGHGPFISEPVEYLLKHQRRNGAIALKKYGLETYNTALAIMALEAEENPKHAAAIEKAKAFLLTRQSRDADPTRRGGFDYGGTGSNQDLNNTLHALEALRAAGLKPDSPAFKNARAFIRNCIDDPEISAVAKKRGGKGTGGAVYTLVKGDKSARPYGSMTYNAVKALLLCSAKKDSPELRALFRWVKNNYSVAENPGAGHKGYFYYLSAFAKALRAAGDKELTLADGRKVRWAKDLAAQLLKLQRPDGSFINDRERKWMEGDPVVCTAYALETLSICYKELKHDKKEH